MRSYNLTIKFENKVEVILKNINMHTYDDNNHLIVYICEGVNKKYEEVARFNFDRILYVAEKEKFITKEGEDN